jgi:arginase
MTSSVAPTGDPENGAAHLRLIWPQWQGAGSPSVHALAPEFAFEVARRGYAVGATVLEAVLPPHDGPTATVPVSMSGDGLEERDGVEAKSVVVKQLGAALEILRQYQPVRITTLGGVFGQRRSVLRTRQPLRR